MLPLIISDFKKFCFLKFYISQFFYKNELFTITTKYNKGSITYFHPFDKNIILMLIKDTDKKNCLSIYLYYVGLISGCLQKFITL